MRRVIHVSVNQNFRNRELTEIRSAYLGLLGLQPGRHRFKKHSNCVPLITKQGRLMKAKTARPQLVTRVLC